jgi:putative transposase
MTSITTKPDSLQPEAATAPHLFDNWFDPIETEVRGRARQFIEDLIRSELDTALNRPRYGRGKTASGEERTGVTGHRHGSRARSLTGTFGPIEIEVPRARLNTADGKTTEWKSRALRAYQRRTLAADALIANVYLAGTNTRRVRRALAALFGGTVGKDTVSRTWRKVKSDWDAWNVRLLAEEPIVRLILDGTVVRVRLDRKATSISLLVVLGVRADGQKVLLAIKSMGGESAEAWRTVLDDLIRRGLQRPEFLIVDGAPGLDKAIAAVWDGVPVQRCTVHKHRNLLAHAPERLHDEITADYNDMIYAATREEIETRRKAFTANGASSIAPSPTAWRKQANACSPSPGCRRGNGAACAPRMRSSGCTKSSSEGSRRRLSCRTRTPLPCCSGHCSPLARSTCAKSMVGKASPQNPSIS